MPPQPRDADDQLTAIRAGFAEAATRQLVKQRGGKWNRDRKLRELRYRQANRQAVALKLDARTVGTAGIQQ